MRQGLYDKLVGTYDTRPTSVIAEPPPPHVATTPVPTPVPRYTSCAVSIIAEPPPPRVAPTPVPPPVPSRLASVPVQPWPPPVFLVCGQPLSQESTATCLKASRGGGR